MNNTLEYKCKKCDAVLKFNSKTENLKCEYCKSQFNLEELETTKNEEKSCNNKIYVYTCNNCGANIISDSNTSIKNCIYCKNTDILKNKLEEDFNPDYLIPFKTTKEDAISAFSKLIKCRWLMPSSFNMNKNIKYINGIYMPFLLCDLDSSGEVNAKCEKVSKWKSNGYEYIKTDTYEVLRGGNMLFRNIPIDISKKISNEVINSIQPYNYEDLKEFNYSYLSGFLSEKYNINKEDLIEEVNEQARNSFVTEMKKDIMGYDNVVIADKTINLYNFKYSYVLLPVWLLNVNYKNKVYTFAMNGQTSKMVGNIPIDKKKVVLMFIVIFAITFIIIFLFSTFSLSYIRGLL